jgi:nucleotide-binding universal stress UspA family protein
MYSVIVVGTDGSATADLALRHAVDLAAASEGSLHIVSSYQPTAGRAGTVSEQWDILPDAGVDSVLDRAVVTARGRGVQAEIHATREDPADAILKVAEQVNADAVVVGNKGMKGAKRFLLGSVPNKVAHNAPCTVVIVKTT